MKQWMKVAALALSLGLLLSGCGQSAKQAEGVVTVNDTGYSMEEYKAAYRFNLMQAEMNIGLPLSSLLQEEEQKTAFHQEVATLTQNYLILLTFCTEKMDEYKLTLDDQLMRQEMDGLAEAIGGQEAIQELAASRGLTLQEFYRLMSIDTMSWQIQDYFMRDTPEADPEYIRENYLRCKHVLISDTENDPEKEALAQKVADLAQEGEEFDQLIQEYNEDPGASRNPDGYVFTAGEMVEPFYQGALALEEDEISEPVRSEFGWHIIQRLPLREEDIAYVGQQIYQQFFQQWLMNMELNVSDEAQTVTFETLDSEPEVQEPAAE